MKRYSRKSKKFKEKLKVKRKNIKIWRKIDKQIPNFWTIGNN